MFKNLRKRKPINYYEPDEPSFDEYVYCESCYDFVYEYCAIHGPLLVIPDNNVKSKDGVPQWVPLAALTTPRPFVHIAQSLIPGAGLGVYSSLTLPRGVRFGPYRGKQTDNIKSMYCWQIRNENGYLVLDGMDAEASNWMRYVNCARNWHEQNLVAFQYKGQIYYRTVKVIPKFTELMVFYGSEFAHALGINLKDYHEPQILVEKYFIDNNNPKQIEMNVEEPLYKTEVLNISEESLYSNYKNNDHLVQTENIQLNKIRKEVLQTNITNNDNNTQTLELPKEITKKITCDICHIKVNRKSFARHKRTHATFLSCSHCSYVTNVRQKNFIHEREHIKNEMYRCDKCAYTSSVKQYFKDHIKRVHNKALTTEDCLTSYKVIDTKKTVYKCSHCSYETNFEEIFTSHFDKHTKSSVYQCDLCSYNTKMRNNCLKHIRNAHGVKNIKCDLCNFKTNVKSRYTDHMERHTKENMYKCDLCSYVSYVRIDYLRHVRKKHKK